MKRKNHIAILSLLNWQGLYVDGKLVVENKSLTASDLAYALKLDVHYHYPGGLPKTKTQKYFDRHNCLPKKLVNTFED